LEVTTSLVVFLTPCLFQKFTFRHLGFPLSAKNCFTAKWRIPFLPKIHFFAIRETPNMLKTYKINQSRNQNMSKTYITAISGTPNLPKTYFSAILGTPNLSKIHFSAIRGIPFGPKTYLATFWSSP